MVPNMLLRVDSEIVLETSVATDCTLALVRPLGGTTTSEHKTGAIVSAYVAAPSTEATAEIRAVEVNTAPAINVTAFGAAGDGVHDDTSAIQAAINAASPGNIVFVPTGRYLTGAISLKTGVELRCASMQGSTFLARSGNEVMFTFSAVSSAGISNCAATGNGNKGVQFLEINTYPAVNNKFRDVFVHDVAVGVRTGDTYFDIFDNVRVFQPTAAGFVFSANSNSVTCNDCSVLSTTPGTIGLQVNNSGAFVYNGGTIEGTVSTRLYQLNAATFIGTYWENTGSVNAGAWVDIGTVTGTRTGAINFIGCNFSVGAYYALNIVQVYGLVARGNSIGTQRAAFHIDNEADAPKYGLDLGNNQINVNGLGFDPVTIYSFAMASDNTLNSNINQDVTNPLLFSATPEPSDASLSNGQGVVYFDSRQRLWYKFKDGAGTVRRWLMGSDALYYNPASVSPDDSLTYALDGTDGAVLSGSGGVRLRRGAAGGSCIGQFGGFVKGSAGYFSSIGLGTGDCLPPADSTVHVMDNAHGSATVLDVEAGDSQGSKPLARFKDHAGNVTAQVNPNGSSNQAGLRFANLPKALNGTIQYCTDCKNIQDGATPGSTAVGGGTGAFLAGINSVWRIMN